MLIRHIKPGVLSIAGITIFLLILILLAACNAETDAPYEVISAQIPYISVQPRGGGYRQGEVISSMSVAAEVTDKGVLSYQWYYTDKSGIAGTKIDGAVRDTFQPAVNEIGNHYFYVIVTNINLNAKGNKISHTDSICAVVSIFSDNEINANAVISIDTGTRYQYVRGFGGSYVNWSNFPNQTAEDTELMYNPDKLGYNIMRVMIPPDNTDINISMKALTSAHRPDYYENVKIVNKYGGFVLASPWSPPAEWKSNKSIIASDSDNYLLREHYHDYAKYLKSFALHMYNKDAPIYAVSIQNDPNYAVGYDGCWWKPEEMRDFFKQEKFFTEGVKGYGGGREIPRVLAMSGESANSPEIHIAALNDPLSNPYIDLLARHNSGSVSKNLWDMEYKENEIWMTEHTVFNNMNGWNDSTWNHRFKHGKCQNSVT